MKDTKTCPRCGGSGASSSRNGLENCSTCNGDGVVSKKAHDKMTDGQRQALGTAGLAAAGFAMGGPLGAAVGGVFGYLATNDDRSHEVSGK